MLPRLTALGVAVAALSALVLYGQTLRFEQASRMSAKAEKTVADLEAEIRVLRAERAFLARPDRIAPYAVSMGLVSETEALRRSTPDPARPPTATAAAAGSGSSGPAGD